jgi:hypothetical protein
MLELPTKTICPLGGGDFRSRSSKDRMAFSHTAKPVGRVAAVVGVAGFVAGATAGPGPFDGAGLVPSGVHEIAVIASATPAATTATWWAR